MWQFLINVRDFHSNPINGYILVIIQEPIASLKNKRHSAFTIIAGDYIVVVGGYKGNGTRINDAEIYIESENRWVELDHKFDLAI